MSKMTKDANPQNMVTMEIFDILKEYSNIENAVSQTEIRSKLRKKHNREISRNALARNLYAIKDFLDMNDFGYKLENVEYKRVNKEEEVTVPVVWYLNKDIGDAELGVLVNWLEFSKDISHNERNELVEKLKKLTGSSLKRSLPGRKSKSNQIFLSFEILSEAINEKKKVVFNLVEHVTNKKEPQIVHENGVNREYTVSPYKIVVSNGRHYLVGAFDIGNKIYNFRLDYIRNIQILDGKDGRKHERVRHIRDVSGHERFDLEKHMAEQIYMFSGTCETVTFRVDRPAPGAVGNMISQIRDWFGERAIFTEEDDKTITVAVTVNTKAMLYWALQFGKYVEILTPVSLRNEVRKAINNMMDKYNA